MIRRSFHLFLASLLVLLAAGCSTVDSRIKEKASVFQTLDASTQAKLREHKVEVGFSTDLVYIALGAPDAKKTRSSAAGTTTTWIYRTYHTEYTGSVRSHYRRSVVIDPRNGRRALIMQPVYTPVYEEVQEDRIRVEFKDGLVTAIETEE